MKNNVVSILSYLILLSSAVACSSPSSTQEVLPSATRPSVSDVETSKVPQVTSKPKQTTIYVKGNLVPEFGLTKIVSEWSRGKYVDLIRTNDCPDDVTIPCVTIIQISDSGPYTGETEFNAYPGDMVIYLFGSLSIKEARITLCHEVGHIVGLWHLTDKTSCMYDEEFGNPSDLPSMSDLKVLDSLGPWSLEKVAKSALRGQH